MAASLSISMTNSTTALNHYQGLKGGFFPDDVNGSLNQSGDSAKTVRPMALSLRPAVRLRLRHRPARQRRCRRGRRGGSGWGPAPPEPCCLVPARTDPRAARTRCIVGHLDARVGPAAFYRLC